MILQDQTARGSLILFFLSILSVLLHGRNLGALNIERRTAQFNTKFSKKIQCARACAGMGCRAPPTGANDTLSPEAPPLLK